MPDMHQQPWLENRKMDLLFILFPAFLPLIFLFAFPAYFTNNTEVTVFWWVLLVLCIDVAHVYSTLFRFYWDPQTYQRFRQYVWIIPLLTFIVAVALHLIDALLFWRVIAYLAVFHFIRQQYGFMRLYARKENQNQVHRLIDSLAVYSATLYPLLYWHIHLTDTLHWFVAGDFFTLANATNLSEVLFYAYCGILGTYVYKEVHVFITQGSFNLPKNLIVAGTGISWYVGIVTCKGDLVFTMFNVVAHGIPYMALVYFFSRKKKTLASSIVPWKSILIFILTVLLLAYFEEGLWDGLLWRDHESVFPFFSNLPTIEHPIVLSFLVPLLALPQLTHYVLDGFIWKVKVIHV